MDHERQFWMEIRRGILVIVAAIDHRGEVSGDWWPWIRQALATLAKGIELRWKATARS